MGRSAAITRVILDLASRQHGVVSRRQLLNQGVPSRTIDGRIFQAGLFVVYPGVYTVGIPQLTKDGALTASLLRAGDGAALGGRSAAAMWGFRRHFNPIEVMSLQGGTNRTSRLRVAGDASWPYLLIRKPKHLPDSELTVVRGLAVTTPARTLRDLAALLSGRQFHHAFTEADRLGLLDDSALAACAERTRGGKGGGTFRNAVDRRMPGIEQTESLLEAIVLQLCVDERIPRPESNRKTKGYRPDFRWPEHRVIVEADGYEFHRGQEMFENDLLRADRLRDDGWDVLRFSWRMLEDHPERVARSIRRALSKK